MVYSPVISEKRKKEKKNSIIYVPWRKDSLMHLKLHSSNGISTLHNLDNSDKGKKQCFKRINFDKFFRKYIT